MKGLCHPTVDTILHVILTFKPTDSQPPMDTIPDSGSEAACGPLPLRSAGDAPEPLVRGLRQPPVDPHPAPHQTLPAQHHQAQVTSETGSTSRCRSPFSVGF